MATDNYNYNPNNGWQYKPRAISDTDATFVYALAILAMVVVLVLCFGSDTSTDANKREESVTMIELKGEDYIKFIEGLDNDKAIYELIKQAVIYNGLAQQEDVTEDDVFRYNAITNEVYKRMN